MYELKMDNSTIYISKSMLKGFVVVLIITSSSDVYVSPYCNTISILSLSLFTD